MKALDLFCGAAGGWSLGLHRAGIETIAACELDPWRNAKFSARWPTVRMYEDVRSLTADRLRSDLGYLPKIIVGSPPCQDASTANAKGKGVDGERTGLFFEALRLVREVRPVWVCFENVPGLKARGYDRIHDELEAAGYEVRPLVVGAWHAGADHRRNRVWIIANANKARLAQRESFGGDARAQRQAAERGPTPTSSADTAQMLQAPLAGNKSDRVAARLWSSVWNGGVAARCGVVDGLPKGLAEKTLGAFGDAVVPILPELIARSMLETA